MKIAQYCLDHTEAYCPGVSRAYYASYQSAKKYLKDNGVDEGNYLERASAWKAPIENCRNRSAFSHDTIWRVLKVCLKVKRVENGFTVTAGEQLRDLRIQADYEETMVPPEKLRSSIKMAQEIVRLLEEANAR